MVAENSNYIQVMSIGAKELILHFLGQINKARCHPKALLKQMEERMLRFDQNDPLLYRRTDIPTIQYRTIEGKEGPKIAHDYLMQKQPVEPLELSYQLSEVAYAVGAKLVQEGTVDISNAETNITIEMANQKCSCNNMNVIIERGFRKDRELVPSIIIDDGNQQRLQRQSLLSDSYRYIGIGVHQHKQYDFQLLLLLADDVVQLGLDPKAECDCSLM